MIPDILELIAFWFVVQLVKIGVDHILLKLNFTVAIRNLPTHLKGNNPQPPPFK